MNIRLAVVNAILKRAVDILCKIDCEEFVNTLRLLRNQNTMILVINHINFLEVPILVAHSYPQPLTGLVKQETWKNPIMAFLFNTYNAIPINRNGAYVQSFQQVKEALNKGYFVCIAPEGTRSKNGILGKGRAGVVQLALVTGAPLLPVVHMGGEKIWENIRHLKRTPFQFRVGQPFRFKFEGRPDRNVRDQMLNELMGQMAALLPEEMRGIYADQSRRQCEYLEFL
jgi:1-acyl-sn-glycerol-3-phosphate acyltransferase